MLTWQEFTVESVQAAIFTPDRSKFSGSRVVAAVLQKFGERLGGDVQVLPIPSDAPVDIPRVTLQSADHSRILTAGPARMDYVWKRVGAQESLALGTAVAECIDVLAGYVTDIPARVDRLALVLQRSCPVADPARELIARFCNEQSQREPFNRSATFEIHNHKRYHPSREGVDYDINSWVRCQCGVLDPGGAPVIAVLQDLNTVVENEPPRQFDAGRIRAFFLMASEEAETIIKKYFPG